MTTAKTITTEEGVEMMNGLVTYAKEALLAGVLKKNIKLAFTNKGIDEDVAQTIVNKGELQFNELSHYKAK